MFLVLEGKTTLRCNIITKIGLKYRVWSRLLFTLHSVLCSVLSLISCSVLKWILDTWGGQKKKKGIYLCHISVGSYVNKHASYGKNVMIDFICRARERRRDSLSVIKSCMGNKLTNFHFSFFNFPTGTVFLLSHTDLHWVCVGRALVCARHSEQPAPPLLKRWPRGAVCAESLRCQINKLYAAI